MIASVSFYPVSPVAPAIQAQHASPVDAALDTAPSWATISRSGEILSKLQDLGQSDPSKLQAALSHVAQDLQTSAQGASGSKAEALTDLASRFTQAASTGDLSALSAGRRHHHVQVAPSGEASTGAAAPAVAAGAAGASSTDSASQALLDNVLAQMDQAMGMNPPPFGPWFTQ